MVATLALDLIMLGTIGAYSDYLAATTKKYTKKFIFTPLDFELAGRPAIFIISLTVIILMLITLFLLLYKTKFGIALRASMENPSLAEIMGVDVEHTRMFSWFLSGALASAAGSLLPFRQEIVPATGAIIIVSIFAASRRVSQHLWSFTGWIRDRPIGVICNLRVVLSIRSRRTVIRQGRLADYSSPNACICPQGHNWNQLEKANLEQMIFNIAFWFGIYAIVALSLNIEYGYGGIPNFGRALAALIGGVTVGGIVNRILMYFFGIRGEIIQASGEAKSFTNEVITQEPIFGIALLLASLALAALLSGVTGALFILPSAKLSEDYLAITLLAMSEVAFLVSYYNSDLIGGYYGVSVPDVLAFAPGEYRLLAFAALTIIVALGSYMFAEKLLNSPYGRTLRSMRENESVAKAYGKDVMRLRIKTVAVGSSMAALAGALYSLYSVNVIATSFSRVEWTFYPILIVLLGGAGNNMGVLLGAFFFVASRILLITYKFEITSMLRLPFEAVWLEYILFGVIMLLILVYRPQGLLKEKPILTRPIRDFTKSLESKIR